MPETTELTTHALFVQYLDVVNRALGEHRDEIPYKQILDTAGEAFEGTTVAAGIHKEGSEPHDWFTFTWSDGSLSLVEHGKGDADLTCKMRQAHLEEVVENPEEYIEHPAKIDLDWLKKTIGLDI